MSDAPSVGAPRPGFGRALFCATFAPPIVFTLASIAAQGGAPPRSELRALGVIACVAWVLSALGVYVLARPLLLRDCARRGGLSLVRVLVLAGVGGAAILAVFGSWLASSLRGAFGAKDDFGLEKLLLIAGIGAVAGLSAALAFWFSGGRASAVRPR